MLRKSRTSAAVLAAALSAGSACASHGARHGEGERARNVILMVPDGMGLADVTATRIHRNGLDGEPLSFETLEHVGYQRTYSRDSTVTDSAAAASAWACGEKFDNGEICLHGDGRPYRPSILQIAQESGRSTGLVATATITHATPAAFGAHVANRSCEQEIARQYVQVTRPDVLLGSGVDRFRSTSADACGTAGDFIAEAQALGYAVAYDGAGLAQAVTQGSDRVLGLFGNGGTVPEYRRTAETTEPHLAEMAAAALAVLERNRRGFFLLVEGSQVDWANHANDSAYQLGEMLAFDDAVRVVRAWIDADRERRESTLLVVVADHDTGGFAINGPQPGLVQPGQTVQAAWTTTGHTGVDTLIWSQGPRSSRLARGAVENTDLYGVMSDALAGRPDEPVRPRAAAARPPAAAARAAGDARLALRGRAR